MGSSGGAQANPIKPARSQGDRDAAPTRTRRQFWTLTVAAVAVCVCFALYLAHDRQSPHASSDPYQAYVGHRWYLQPPTSSSGYIELDDAGAFTTYDTEEEYFGTYAITDTGQLVVRSTHASSTGTPKFDQTVVNALAPLNKFATNNNSVPKTMMIRPMNAASFSLDVEGHILTFSDK